MVMKMVSTIYDVAKLAGVSTATVSRVINKIGNVSPKTELKVKRAMEQLSFTPNSLAQSFAKMKNRTIGLINPIVASSELSGVYTESIYFTELFRGINKILFSEEYSILLINSKNNFKHIVQEFLDQKRIEGLIVGANPFDLDGFKEAVIQKKSIVYIGKILGFDYGLHVYAQYTKYIDEVLKYFMKNGHKKIAYFGISEHKDMIDKLLNENNKLEIDYHNEPDTIEELHKIINDLFCNENRPTALFYESFEKIQAVLSILNELNLKVPNDVSLISIEHKKGLGDSYVPQITNVYVPAYEMGKIAAKVLMDYLNGRIDNYNQQFDVESNIIERGSVKKIGE